MLPFSLGDLIFWVAVVACAAAQWFIVRHALVAPESTRDGSPPTGGMIPAGRRGAEIVWAVLPAVALALVLAATWRAIHPERRTELAPAPAEHTAGWGVARGPAGA